MKKKSILVVNGPNINMLGVREKDIYGEKTYFDLCYKLISYAKHKGVRVRLFQSNHEGDIIDTIQSAYKRYDGIIINAGGYTHTSIAIADAVAAVNVPTVEVHISNINEREDFRKISYIRPKCIGEVVGKGIDGYREALDMLLDFKAEK